MNKIKNIIILAGGKSTRFWPLTDKNFFCFLSRQLLSYQIEKFLPHAENIFIVANRDNNHKADLVSSLYKNITVLKQKEEGQAMAILSACNKVFGEALIINNSDIFNEKIIFSEIAKKRNKYKLILTAKKMKEYFPGGYLKLNGKDVIKLVEKPAPDKRPSDVVRLVVDYFADFGEFIEILKKLKAPNKDGAYEDVLNTYISKTSTAYINYSDYWYFLKYPWHVLSIMRFFLGNLESIFPKSDNINKKIIIDKTAIIKGNVYLEEGVKVQAYAKIAGPCYIGKNSVVGNYALIRESMIGEKCMIGGYSEIARSYLGNNVWLHRNYIGDSIIENNVLLGAGSVFANFRFDEKEIKSKVKGFEINTGFTKLGAMVGSFVKFGINSSIMPGVKIGSNNFINPNALVKKDIITDYSM